MSIQNRVGVDPDSFSVNKMISDTTLRNFKGLQSQLNEFYINWNHTYIELLCIEEYITY